MNTDSFLRRLAEVLDYPELITPGQSLTDIDVWDSLGRLSVVDLLDELGVTVDLDALAEIETTDQLLAMVASVVHDA
jgi:acyl carrier protein